MTFEPSGFTTPSNQMDQQDQTPSYYEERMARQNETLQAKSKECEEFLAKQITIEGYCSGVWDRVICWSQEKPGKLAVTACPEYVAGFNAQHSATRFCTQDGTWFVHPITNSTWTNYSQCTTHGHSIAPPDQLIANWLPVIKRISQVGYSVSFVTLVIALFILLSIKKLRCPRNTLHMHLFVSFMCRAFMALLKDSLFIEGIGLSQSVVDGMWVNEISTWQCKLVTSLWQYFIVANYTWILMEGLYLHNLIFLAPFSDSSAITAYVFLGWGCPIPVVGAWIISRALLDDSLCWTTHNSPHLFLIIRIPIILTIVLNFIFFLNIVRVLLLKLQSAVSIETRKYRKWAKSTLVLVPLFGVHYMLFIGMSFYVGRDPVIEVTWLFCDQLFASSQGCFVAVLYCLLNGEVRCELGKKWTTWKSETETKNIWVPLNHITTRMQRR
ncbi:unnamed protein product [Orchesella dallaii]|uniref:Parathyroid hormone/parathyroid hormone-related peptide receptor n=1 Tax=Orchesella dallaii TaxID=48710 RepID=A0ABP1QRF6_9HEXA